MVEVSSLVSHEETLAEFSHALQRAGVRDAVACLLRLTSYRCGGIFRFEGERVQAAVAVGGFLAARDRTGRGGDG